MQLYVLIGLALVFDFLNGFHDSSNIVATVIASRAMNPRRALLLTAAANFTGPFLFGVAVAETVGRDLLDIQTLDLRVVIAALIAAVIWNLITWYYGIPSSSSHALVGGLLGAALLSAGIGVVRISGVIKIAFALIFSPIFGLIIGFIIMRITIWSVRGASPRINSLFRGAQSLTLIGLALSHGANDAQKTIGVITMGLVAAGGLPDFRVPLWVILISASAIAFGASIGGWRLIHTLGNRLYRIRPVHGFSSQIAGAVVILGAALLGGPVSTTQVMGSSIMGVGAADRVNMVRWTLTRNMLMVWLITIPVCAALAALALLILTRF